MVQNRPRYITAIYDHNGSSGLQLQGFNDAAGTEEVRTFVVNVGGHWTAVQNLLPIRDVAVEDFTILLKGNGIGIRPLPINQNNVTGTGWIYFLEDESQKWKSARETLKDYDMPADDAIWSLEEFGHGVGLQIEYMAHSDGGASYLHKLFILDEEHKWHPLEQVAPLENLPIVRADTDGLKSALAVRAPVQETQSGGWRLLFKDASDRWQRWSRPGAGSNAIFDVLEFNWDAGVVRGVTDAGQELLFLRSSSDSTWVECSPSPFSDFY